MQRGERGRRRGRRGAHELAEQRVKPALQRVAFARLLRERVRRPADEIEGGRRRRCWRRAPRAARGVQQRVLLPAGDEGERAPHPLAEHGGAARTARRRRRRRRRSSSTCQSDAPPGRSARREAQRPQASRRARNVAASLRVHAPSSPSSAHAAASAGRRRRRRRRRAAPRRCARGAGGAARGPRRRRRRAGAPPTARSAPARTASARRRTPPRAARAGRGRAPACAGGAAPAAGGGTRGRRRRAGRGARRRAAVPRPPGERRGARTCSTSSSGAPRVQRADGRRRERQRARRRLEPPARRRAQRGDKGGVQVRRVVAKLPAAPCAPRAPRRTRRRAAPPAARRAAPRRPTPHRRRRAPPAARGRPAHLLAQLRLLVVLAAGAQVGDDAVHHAGRRARRRPAAQVAHKLRAPPLDPLALGAAPRRARRRRSPCTARTAQYASSCSPASGDEHVPDFRASAPMHDAHGPHAAATSDFESRFSSSERTLARNAASSATGTGSLPRRQATTRRRARQLAEAGEPSAVAPRSRGARPSLPRRPPRMLRFRGRCRIEPDWSFVLPDTGVPLSLRPDSGEQQLDWSRD